MTGGAGTGKTSVLKVFLQELVRAEGRHPTLLLAPTGKARVRLSTKTTHNAMTIHQFLLKQGWFVPDIFALKPKSDRSPFQATTVVVDECSMIPTDLFGTLLRALDSGPLSRLILVGDSNQLPPIGPGRPFADIIDWLQKEHADCIAALNVCMRTDEHEGDAAEDSVALALADGYRASVVSPGDDEILAAVARGESGGDLEVEFWDDHDELLERLRSRMAANLGIRDDDYKTFNRSLGIDTNSWVGSEAWQILSPTRAQHFGTYDLNRLIQQEYKGGLIVQAKNPYSNSPRPFGDQEIVWTDKVIQVINRSINGWPRNAGLNYVANGEIGIVRSTKKGTRSAYLDIVFSTQTDVSYRYFGNQVNDNLELAYALTVHKAQGSDFEVVFLIIPQKASTLSRELIYTGLTRFRRKLVLLIEKDIEPLRRLRSPDCSDTRLRNTHMFTLALRSDDVKRPHLEALIHRTRKGVAVRSKSEVIVADTLASLDISYSYEQPLFSRSDPKRFPPTGLHRELRWRRLLLGTPRHAGSAKLQCGVGTQAQVVQTQLLRRPLDHFRGRAGRQYRRRPDRADCPGEDSRRIERRETGASAGGRAVRLSPEQAGDNARTGRSRRARLRQQPDPGNTTLARRRQHSGQRTQRCAEPPHPNTCHPRRESHIAVDAG